MKKLNGPINKLFFKISQLTFPDRILLTFSLVLNLILNISNFDLHELQIGLDPSYIYGYNSAFLNGLTFGREIISTYGPLGFLVHGLELGRIPVLIITFYTLFGLLSGLAVFSLIRKGSSYSRLGLIFAVSYLVSIQIYEWRMLAVFIILEVSLLLSKRRNLYFLSSVWLFAWLLMFVKISLGITAISSFIIWGYFYTRQLNLEKKRSTSLALILLTGSYAVGIFLLRSWSFADLFNYVKYGLVISSGYSQAMGLSFAKEGAVNSIFIILTLITLTIYIVYSKNKRWWLLFIAPALFTVWKASVVRQDVYGHVESYALFMIFVVALFSIVLSSLNKKLIKPIMLFATISTGLLTYSLFLSGITATRMTSILRDPLTFWKAETCQLAKCLSPNSAKLEPHILEIIGDSTVDVYPWNESYVEANKLNWSSRPSYASYATYSPTLDDANAKFFDSTTAPEIILWHHDTGVQSIDGRYLLHDEPKTIRTIINNYRLIHKDDKYSVLKINRDVEPLNVNYRKEEKKLIWGVWNDFRGANSEYVKIKYKPNFSQKFKTLLYRPDVVLFSFKRIDGSTGTFRMTTNNLMQGVAIGSMPFSQNELQDLLSINTSSLPVVSIRPEGVSTGDLNMLFSE